MVHHIHIAVLDVDIPARQLYEARGLCSAHFRAILRETAANLNKTLFSEKEQLDIKITPYDIRGSHYPDLYKLRGHVGDNKIPVAFPVDAVMITGGTPGVYEMERSPWMQELKEFVRTVYAHYPQVRILGTCFGHQLISHAIVRNKKDPVRDVWVEKCPLGREVGIHNVQLTKEFQDAFPAALGGLPDGKLRIQMFHGDRVMAVEKGTPLMLDNSPPVCLPAPWINIGSTQICPIQGLYHPGRVLTVQGHYETDAFGLTQMCLDAAPNMGWKESKLALFLEQVGDDTKGDQCDRKTFASAVVSFLAGVEQ